ncbi:MAG: hypothetical protein KAH20_16930 [Methylococcales bacterium]|nr:hypothetical protein [Methylococcales bacterium]
MKGFEQLKIILVAMCLAFFSNLVLADDVPSTCDDSENALFISLSTDDTWKASMALGYAKKNLEHGPVTIFMNVTGTRIAVKESKLPHDFYALNKKTTQDSLKAFLEAGGRGLVCPNCIVRAGFKPMDIIEHNNLEMGKADLVRSELDCSEKQLSW